MPIARPTLREIFRRQSIVGEHAPMSVAPRTRSSGGNSSQSILQRTKAFLNRKVEIPRPLQRPLQYAKYGLFAPAFGLEATGSFLERTAVGRVASRSGEFIARQFAPAAIKQRAIFGGLGLVGLKLYKKALFNQPLTLPTGREAAGVAGYTASGIIGLPLALASQSYATTRDIFGFLKKKSSSLPIPHVPSIPTFGVPEFNFGDYQKYLHDLQVPGSVNLSSPVFTPSISIAPPSVSVSAGGGPDFTPLLALLAGGLGGYALGRKKRKKYKRRKRSRRHGTRNERKR